MAEDPSPTAPESPLNGAPNHLKPGPLRAAWTRHRQKLAARSRARRRTARVLKSLALLVVVLAGGGAGYVYSQLNRIHHVSVPELEKPTGPATDILLVGSTSRCAVTASKYLKNFNEQCQAGVNGVNSDVIMIVRLQPGKTPTLLSIPRDTFVPNARQGGLYNKIDAALADGPSQLVDAIQQDFGIPINHYVVLNFGTFANIVTALGGITMYFPTSLYDAQSGLDISHSGCLHISGLEALALVRARHLQYNYDRKTKTWRGYDPSGDIGRIERVHVFLKVLAAEVAKRGLSNPITDSELLAAIAPDLTVDDNFSTTDMASLVLRYHSDVSGAPEYTLPVIEDSTEYSYKGYDYGLIVFPSEPQDSQTISKFMNGATPSAPAASSYTVSVVDGTDSASATASIASALGALGYKVTSTATAVPVGPISETTVAYKPGFLSAAEAVKRSLSGTVIVGQEPTYDGADVSVITGSDLTVASTPAPATPTTTASGPTTATAASPGSSVVAMLVADVLDAAAASTVSSADSPLSSPTPAVTPLPPYDPRACPPTSK